MRSFDFNFSPNPLRLPLSKRGGIRTVVLSYPQVASTTSNY